MLHGRRIDLRARAPEDVEILHAELYDDVSGHARSDGRAWRPHPHGMDGPFAPKAPSSEVAEFSVVLRDSGEVLGNALLWSIDEHNRSAHVGMALRPAHRGQGYGTEILELLCRYGFALLGLHRLQLETLGDNVAMMALATGRGFQLEGTTRGSSWVEGRFVDDAVFGLLAEEWAQRDGDAPHD